ncbi:MAG: DUF5615 family PIN-like protein [Xanthomonadaceae bacterium]|nr:DUF5615 family PIN-like protein [Xanthomonadaceae bacterium]
MEKLLRDENLSPRLVKRLDDLFPGTLHVRDIGLKADLQRPVYPVVAIHSLARGMKSLHGSFERWP